MNQEERLGSLQTEIELLALNPKQLQAELDKALADLKDIEELRHGFLGQTGVHIGMRVLQSARRQFEREDASLKARVALLEELLCSAPPLRDLQLPATIASAQQAFDKYSQQYDARYDSPRGRAFLATEVSCLRPLLERFPRPYLEVGVGTGRFAEALGVECGVDPSPRVLAKARRRGVEAVLAIGEDVPFGDAHFGGVLMAFTLCFLGDPYRAMREARRVLAPGGGLVLGLLLRDTPWADWYARRGAEGHSLYRMAHFYSREEVEALLQQVGFHITAYRSTLFQGPGLENYHEEPSVEGYEPGAGFTGIAAVKPE